MGFFEGFVTGFGDAYYEDYSTRKKLQEAALIQAKQQADQFEYDIKKIQETAKYTSGSGPSITDAIAASVLGDRFPLVKQVYEAKLIGGAPTAVPAFGPGPEGAGPDDSTESFTGTGNPNADNLRKITVPGEPRKAMGKDRVPTYPSTSKVTTDIPEAPGASTDPVTTFTDKALLGERGRQINAEDRAQENQKLSILNSSEKINASDGITTLTPETQKAMGGADFSVSPYRTKLGASFNVVGKDFKQYITKPEEEIAKYGPAFTKNMQTILRASKKNDRIDTTSIPGAAVYQSLRNMKAASQRDHYSRLYTGGYTEEDMKDNDELYLNSIREIKDAILTSGRQEIDEDTVVEVISRAVMDLDAPAPFLNSTSLDVKASQGEKIKDSIRKLLYDTSSSEPKAQESTTGGVAPAEAKIPDAYKSLQNFGIKVYVNENGEYMAKTPSGNEAPADAVLNGLIARGKIADRELVVPRAQ